MKPKFDAFCTGTGAASVGIAALVLGCKEFGCIGLGCGLLGFGAGGIAGYITGTTLDYTCNAMDKCCTTKKPTYNHHNYSRSMDDDGIQTPLINFQTNAFSIQNGG